MLYFIGITGSNGKTSTKDLVAGMLSPYFRVKKTEGNFNNELGLAFNNSFFRRRYGVCSA